MDNAGYIGLSRSAGLMRELNAVANNIANLSTNGYRREGSVFAEHVKALDGGDPSISMTSMSHRYTDMTSGDIVHTSNALDFAIPGEGFFLVETPGGPRMTRDGAFSVNAIGELVTASGDRVLNESGGSIIIPPQAEDIQASDGGVIFADNQAVGRLGVVVADPATMVREGKNLFRPEEGYQPVENPVVRQRAIEGSNVSAVTELARLIEVQRMYEASKSFTDNESDRIRQTVRTLSQE